MEDARPAAAVAGMWARATLWEILAASAADEPHRLAFVQRDDAGLETFVSYEGLAGEVVTLSAGLARIGVRRGDRLALWMTNRREWITTCLAATRLGAIVVPINTWYTPREVAYVLRNAGVRHLVLLDRFRKIDFVRHLDTLVPDWRSSRPGHVANDDLPDLRTVVLVRREEDAPRPGEQAGALDYHAVLALGRDDEAQRTAAAMAAAVRPGDVAMIQYTTGSTGFPKGAMLEHWGFVTNGRLHADRLDVTADDGWFSAMPFFHNGGSIWGLMTCLASRATLYYTEAFDARTSLDMLATHRCTVWFASPTMVRDVLGLLPSEPRDLSSVRLASAADPAIAADLRQVIPGVATTNPYGMTETYAPAAAASPSSPAEQHVTAGLPLDGVEVRVIDPATGADLPRGQAGEGLVRGIVMRGYWNQPEATAAALDADGWMHTGDLLRIEDDGRIVYAGRIKNMLRVGSENVSAEEVEAVLSGHPAVHSAAVLGVKDPRRDEVPWAYVQLHAGAEATEVDLERWCREQLASFKVPRRFVILDELPVAGSGKLDRLAIRKLADETSAT